MFVSLPARLFLLLFEPAARIGQTGVAVVIAVFAHTLLGSAEETTALRLSLVNLYILKASVNLSSSLGNSCSLSSHIHEYDPGVLAQPSPRQPASQPARPSFLITYPVLLALAICPARSIPVSQPDEPDENSRGQEYAQEILLAHGPVATVPVQALDAPRGGLLAGVEPLAPALSVRRGGAR